jgi:lipoprotein-anchoring transpeptidase ErfK/SrfK
MRVDGLGASMATGKLEPLKASNRSSTRAFSNSWWRIAILTAAGTIGVASQAEATIFWPDSDPGFSQPAPEILAPPQKRKVRPPLEGRSQKGRKGIEAQGKETAKPHGPLVIAISINKQSMKIYDANGFFAETPISTGMRGHPTPMGVFSVVQKEKLHHSNIYSGAPMPYMQRITWSGIAIHAGVLPGYPASHGCIRMPMAFAVKMYGWTRMGARVVITPDETVPTNFSHPLLVAQKIVPQPVAADEPNAAAKADKATNMAMAKPAASEVSLELRSTVGHDNAKSLMGAATRTADASAITNAMSDSRPAGDNLPAREQPVARADSPPSTASAKLEAESATAERAEIASADDKAVEITSSQATSPEIKSAETSTDKTGAKPDQIAAPENIKADASKATAKPEDSVKAATDLGNVPDQKKDQGHLLGTEKAPAAKPVAAAPAAPKRTGQIAVFVSRKDSKLYVRQNFAPLFDVPVTIAPSDRPLGTHVFTAEVDKADPNVLHWSVVSLPKPSRYVERRDEDERVSRRRKMAGAIEIKAPAPEPDGPAEALDRLTIPADARARIAEALSTGSSIIVSDQGIAGGETGEGTDFIVSLR